MWWIAALLALVVGALLGLLGGGGSILTVPMLVYIVGVSPKSAIPTSLIVVGTTAVAALVPAARAGNVRFRAGAFVAGGAMAGAFLGGLVAKWLSGTALLALFGALMLGASLAMMRKRGDDGQASSSPARAVPAVPAVAAGAAIGILSGLVGAGGGFLIVPVLVLILRVPMRDAVGTSLFVIALQSIAGFAGQISHASVDWTLAAVVTVASVAGSQIGVRLGKHLSPTTLRSAFAWFVLVLGAVVLSKEVHPAVGLGGTALVLTAIALLRRRAPAEAVAR